MKKLNNQQRLEVIIRRIEELEGNRIYLVDSPKSTHLLHNITDIG